MINEIIQPGFRPIPGYEGLYSIDESGYVYGHKSRKILKWQTYKNGYLFVQLYKKNNSKIHLIHRLVAMTYIPNPEGKAEVDHLDTNKANNNVSNLRWCSHIENCRNKLSIQHLKDAVGGGKSPLCGRKLPPETIEKMRASRIGKKYSEEHRRNISRALKGRKLPPEILKKIAEARRGKYCEGGRCNLSKSVSQFTEKMELIKIWDCIKTASKTTGIDYHEILKCRAGKKESAGGFIWR